MTIRRHVKFSTMNLDRKTVDQAIDELEKIDEQLKFFIEARMLPDACLPALRTAFFATQKALQEIEQIKPSPTWFSKEPA